MMNSVEKNSQDPSPPPTLAPLADTLALVVLPYGSLYWVEIRDCSDGMLARTPVREPGVLLPGPSCQSRWGRSVSTALSPNDSLGFAEIRHPFHPLKGQRFAVLKARCVGGVDTLILRNAERGSFAVARQWTDLATPNSCERADGSTGRFDAHSLCDLVTLLELLTQSAQKGVAK